MRILILIGLVLALGYWVMSAASIMSTFNKPDAMTLFFECVDTMERDGVGALESMSFCKGILNAE